jgi:hypothetical protein
MSAAAFALDIDRQWAEEQDSLRDAVVFIGLQAVNRTVLRSPVDTGRFRGNWTLSFGGLEPTVTEATDPGGARTIARLSAEIETYPQEGFPVIYLQNNLPYAERLEGGYSSQAPGGVVAITVAELAAIWERTEL